MLTLQVQLCWFMLLQAPAACCCCCQLQVQLLQLLLCSNAAGSVSATLLLLPR